MGIIAGYGAENEIKKENVALERNFIFADTAGVIGDGLQATTISANQGTNGVSVGAGYLFAYGYVGAVNESKFVFTLPAGTQYRFIYAEIDLSQIPNTCILKVKNNGAKDTAQFRQDYLLTLNGVFELPLWRVKLTRNGIEQLTDLRDKKYKIGKAEEADILNGFTGANTTGTTQSVSDESTKIATTKYVANKARLYLNLI